jgi:nucleotide-binding universal stress UspA family protein
MEDSMKIDHILFPVDFSEHSRSLNSEVEWLASHFNSHVTLLHVFEVPTSWYGEGEIPLIRSEDILAYAESEKQLLKDYVIEIPENRVQRVSAEGGPAWHIANWTRQHDVDLIVMGTHGYGAFRRFMLGSVAMKVMHDVSCPVWMRAIHSKGAGKIAKVDHISNIVCAVEITDEAVPLLRFTKELATDLGADVRLVHKMTDTESLYKCFDLVKLVGEEISSLQTRAGTDFPVSLIEGYIAQDTTAIASQRGADLIVIGRGKTQAPFGGLRTHAYEIIRQAPCSVLSYSMDWHPGDSSVLREGKVPDPVANK